MLVVWGVWLWWESFCLFFHPERAPASASFLLFIFVFFFKKYSFFWCIGFWNCLNQRRLFQSDFVESFPTRSSEIPFRLTSGKLGRSQLFPADIYCAYSQHASRIPPTPENTLAENLDQSPTGEMHLPWRDRLRGTSLRLCDLNLYHLAVPWSTKFSSQPTKPFQFSGWWDLNFFFIFTPKIGVSWSNLTDDEHIFCK